MSTNLEIAKQVLSPPGDTIQETLEEIGMSQVELAERVGRPKEKINDIIHGREPISTHTAFLLERVLGIPASFWLNREKEYRKRIYELEQQEFFEKCLEWYKEFPIPQLKTYGVLPNTKEKDVLVQSLLSFFGVGTPNQWERIYLNQEVSVAFRISLANTNSPHAMSAWLRIGELEAKKLELEKFDKHLFKDSLKDIKEIAYKHPDNFSQSLQDLCTKCGVAVVYVRNLPKAPISGATRWFQNVPLIQLSGRYKTNDHFWFTFFHEAGHILLHGKKDIFLENVQGTDMDETKEDEANLFASKILLKESELQEIIDNAPVDLDMIVAFADKFRTPAGVIVGRLQREELIHYSQGNELRQKIDLFA